MFRTWTTVAIGILVVESIFGSLPQLSDQTAEHLSDPQLFNSVSANFQWRKPAQLHRLFPLPNKRGTLFVNNRSVEFISEDGRKLLWKFSDIRELTIAPRRLVLDVYGNRILHYFGGEEREFNLSQIISPAQAAGLARSFARPSRNEVPDPASPFITELPAVHRSVPVHHRVPSGGTSGVLRFREGGIDYITNSPGDSRSWRWEDLQTLLQPDPHRLNVIGYLDAFAFDLKEPVDRASYERATTAISTRKEKPISDAAPVKPHEK